MLLSQMKPQKLTMFRVALFTFCVFSMSVQCAVAQNSVDATQTPAAKGTVAPANVESERRTSAELLPTSTRLWISMEDLRRLERNVANTQMGKLARQDTLAPFFASFEKQLRDSLNSNGIKFGLDVASVEGMEAGEVAFAGVLPDVEPGVKPTPGSHGIVVLIDVSPNLVAAQDFLDAASEKMKERGAKLEQIEVLGEKVSRYTIEVRAAKISRMQYSFVSIVDGWLLASDNQSIFANIVRRIKNKEKGTGVLAGYEPFVTVQKKTKVQGVSPDLSWFVDPLGYARFADALAEEKAEMREPKDRPLEALSKEGLDALKAAGGFVSFSTGEHDVLHRSLVYANPAKAKGIAQQRLLALLDFAPQGSSVAKVPNWVPEDVAGYFSGNWAIEKAFENVAPFFDTVVGVEGSFEDTVKQIKEDPNINVDMRKMVQALGDRVTIISKSEEPIDEKSEKMILGVELKDGVDGEWLVKSIGRAVQGKVKKLVGFTTVTDDRTESGGDDDMGDFEIIEDEFGDLEDIEDEKNEEEVARVTLFNLRIFVVRDGYLFVCNDKDFLKQFLSQNPSDKFSRSSDFKRMSLALSKFSDENLVHLRMFNRLDRMWKTNYEMLRTGRMADSETFVARLLNQAYGKEGTNNEKRQQQIDGSSLPSDYEKEIAPFLGYSGLVMETTDSGWRFSGCVLPKAKAKAVVAEAQESQESSK